MAFPFFRPVILPSAETVRMAVLLLVQRSLSLKSFLIKLSGQSTRPLLNKSLELSGPTPILNGAGNDRLVNLTPIAISLKASITGRILLQSL